MTEKTQKSPNQVDTQAEPTKHAEKTLIDRRDFLATSAAVVGSTAVFGFWLPGKAEAAAAAAGVVEGEVVRVAPTPWYRQAMVYLHSLMNLDEHHLLELRPYAWLNLLGLCVVWLMLMLIVLRLVRCLP